MTKPTVALVFGGASPEHEVSLVSARGIAAKLDRSRWDLLFVGVDRQGQPRAGDESLLARGLDDGAGTPVRWPAAPGDRTLREQETGRAVTPPIDIVFPIVHGAGGEDGTLQGVMRLAGVRCVGPGVLGSALAMDKDRARRVLAAEGIPVVVDVVVSAERAKDVARVAAAIETLGMPVFVKPARTGSSVGITKLMDIDGLADALAEAARFDSKIVIERAVPDAREIEVAVLGAEGSLAASVCGEIVPHGEFYSYEAKYHDDRSKLLIPAPLDEATAARIRELAMRGFRALDLHGMARIDFLLSRRTGELVLNEANTLPGFTPISMYPRLWEATGLPYQRLLDRLLDLAR